MVYNNVAFVQNLINGHGQKTGHGIKFTRSTINVHDVVCFLWLSMPGDYRVTDEALLAETT